MNPSRYLQISKAKPLGDPNGWVFGFYIYDLLEGHYIITISDERIIEKIYINKDTLCTCTGIFDATGRAIFTGDCLGQKNNVVEYLSGGFCLNGDRDLWPSARDFAVVSNIYDKKRVRKDPPYLKDIATPSQLNHFQELEDLSDEKILIRLLSDKEEWIN